MRSIVEWFFNLIRLEEEDDLPYKQKLILFFITLGVSVWILVVIIKDLAGRIILD